MKVKPEEMGTTKETMEEEGRKFLDNESKLKGLINSPKVLCMHALYDTLVPSINSEKLYKWVNSDEKQIEMLHDGDHNDILIQNYEKYTSTMKNFLESVQEAHDHGHADAHHH